MSADSPWKTMKEAGARVDHGPRFMRREWAAGRLRGAVIGGRKEVLTSDEWIDQWVTDQAQPIGLHRRAG